MFKFTNKLSTQTLQNSLSHLLPFERRTPTGSGHFAFFSSGFFAQIFAQIVFTRVRTLKNTNLVAWRHRYWERRQQKRATCFAALLQTELCCAFYQPRINPVLQPIRLLQKIESKIYFLQEILYMLRVFSTSPRQTCFRHKWLKSRVWRVYIHT